MKKSKKTKSKEEDLFIVGVGASAGGLDAITKFLSGINGIEHPIAVVIVMHLSPDYVSELKTILEKRSKWPVVKVTNNTELKPHHIYVTPQNKNIELDGNRLQLQPLPENYSTAPSIDHFLTSLATHAGQKAIGVIVSGFGSDGSLGIREINKKRGLTIAQLPDTAEHRDMPMAAIKTDNVDLIFPPEQMLGAVSQYIENLRTIVESDLKQVNIDAILELLEKRSGTDFTQYKSSTILRRIKHRMSTLLKNSLEDYYETLKHNPMELDELFHTVLIGVTEFFRDAKAFENLRDHLITLIDQKKSGDTIRVWSVGCATGEEPYSIAILLHELLDTKLNHYQVQVFASDIDEQALNYARRGVYPKDRLVNLPNELVERYFDQKGENHFEIKKRIKSLILFSKHNIAKDPPFVRLDLIVCRNLLIYFTNNLQKQTFQIFHYALRNTGVLFLGKSESVSVAANLFRKIDNTKIFRKADSGTSYQLRFSKYLNRDTDNWDGDEQRKTRHLTLRDVAKETLFLKYEHPFIIIDENSQIKEVHGSLRLYLEIGEGSMNANLFRMANQELVTPLKALTAQVKTTEVPHVSQVLKFDLYDTKHYVKIRVTPLLYPVNESRHLMVTLIKIDENEQLAQLQRKLDTEELVDLRIQELEDELATTKEHLQIFTEELEATNEELQTINEELQSSNEELKTSNEELETSNEELQSANEELNTANNELRLSNEALIEKEQELKEAKERAEKNELIYRTIAKNLPNGSIGLLDKDFRVEFIAGQALAQFGLSADEMVGKPLPEFNPNSRDRNILTSAFNAALKGNADEAEIEYEGHVFELQALPIEFPHSDDKKIMFMTQDITDQKAITTRLEEEVGLRMKELRKTNEKLVKLNQNLEEYAHAASHDLQEPLRKIETFISILQSGAEDPTNYGNYLSKIEDSAHRMRSLVTDILSYHSLTEIKDVNTVNLDLLIDEIKQDLALLIEEKNALLHAAPLGSIEGSQSQLYQLFANLIQNSLTYNKEKQPIVQVSRQVRNGSEMPLVLNADKNKVYHCFQLQDNGIGFEIGKFSHILKPFKRLHSKSEFPGSGLGLTICDRIIGNHNGLWSVESAPGKGSIFTICLPKLMQKDSKFGVEE